MKFIRKSLGAQALMAAVLIIGLYFGYSFARELVQAERLTRQIEAATSRNEMLAEENRKLERDSLYYASDEYAELRARTDLNLRKADELVILPVMPADEPQIEAPVAEAAPAEEAASEAEPAAVAVESARNWDRWLALFTSAR